MSPHARCCPRLRSATSFSHPPRVKSHVARVRAQARRVAATLRERAAAVAAREGKTISQLAREALEERIAPPGNTPCEESGCDYLITDPPPRPYGTRISELEAVADEPFEPHR